MRNKILAIVTIVAVGLGVWTASAYAGSDEPTQAANGATSAKAFTLRVATFNVRTAHATKDKRVWLQRVHDVARTIKSRDPGIAALQELTPGRADGKYIPVRDSVRQTESLVNALRDVGAGKYQLVRTTAYREPGVKGGTQGQRLLYDTSRFVLRSNCPEKTGKRNYSPSCSIKLFEDGKDLRLGAYAQFLERSTGREFLVVSVHLSHRHSKNTAKEKHFEALRARHMRVILDTVSRVNSRRLPVIVGGDLNTWQTHRFGVNARDVLDSAGFVESATARTAINLQYPTINHFKTVLDARKNKLGAPRLDVLYGRGFSSVERHENVTSRVDSARPSDHNLVVADFRLGSGA